MLDHAPQRQHKTARIVPAFADDDEVLTFKAWCSLNAISSKTGRRILAGQTPPTVTKLTDRKIGITRRNNRIWQESRAR